MINKLMINEQKIIYFNSLYSNHNILFTNLDIRGAARGEGLVGVEFL